MSDTLISVVVPIFGVEKYLRQCIDSILGQRYRNLQVILVDDGSRDSCPQICDHYALTDKRVVVVHKENEGYGASINRGIAEARGEWLAIVEPDDWLSEEMFSELANAIRPDVDVVKCNFVHVREWNGTCVENSWTAKPPNGVFSAHQYPQFLEQHPCIWTCLYRLLFLKEKEIGMKPIPGAGWVDNPFSVATLCSAKGIVYVDKALYHYRATESDVVALKGNWRIPYERSVEMLSWLKSHDISSAEIHATVFRHITYYLRLMSYMMVESNREEIIRATKHVCSLFNLHLIYQAKSLCRMWRQVLWLYVHFPVLRIQANRSLCLHRLLRVLCYLCLWV